jgi:hypothetical protein
MPGIMGPCNAPMNITLDSVRPQLDKSFLAVADKRLTTVIQTVQNEPATVIKGLGAATNKKIAKALGKAPTKVTVEDVVRNRFELQLSAALAGVVAAIDAKAVKAMC